MTDRLAGLERFAWLDREASSACCMANDIRCQWATENLSPGEVARQAREHTRTTGHDTRVYHRKVVEYSAAGTGSAV